jgi:hypothetical protein
VAPRRVAELTVAERRRATLKTLARFLATFCGVIAAYYVLPFADASSDAQAVASLLIGAALFVGLMLWEVRRIVRADLPELRSVEAIAVAVPFFLTIYAGAYVTLSELSPGSFTQPLNRTAALYYSIVTFGTVGYGDIAPVSDLARILVSTQVLGDLVFIALVLRIVAGAARAGLQRRGEPADGEPSSG